MRTALALWMSLAAAVVPIDSRAGAQPVNPRPRPPKVTILTEDGGHLAWHPRKAVIAFDRMDERKFFRPWFMNADGTQQRPMNITVPGFPTKHAGQPAWHPSGDFLALQAQQQDCPRWIHTQAVPGAGVLNDLWIVSADGRRGWKVVALSPHIGKHSAALLHPHFSPDGRMLIWSERISGRAEPFGEWVIKAADFAFTPAGEPQLSGVRVINPGQGRFFYETHSFHPDGASFLYSGQQDTGLEIYRYDLRSGQSTRLTKDAAAWDEHAHFSPDGSRIAWISSRGLRFTARPFDLQTEFWLMNADGTNARRLTRFHDPGSTHFLDKEFAVAADCDWSPDGKSLAGLVITGRPESAERGKGMIVRIDFD